MFVFSLKTSRKTLLVGIACLALFLVLLASIIWNPSADQTVETIAAATVEEQLSFLRSIGCEAAAEPMAVEEIKLPDTPDEAFDGYNALQKEGGFDLSDHLGKRVKVWSYMTTCGERAAVAHLYIYRGTLVGGDLTDPATGQQRALMKGQEVSYDETDTTG